MSNLNPQQTAAVESTAPDQVIVACPGSGKTTTLIAKIKRWLEVERFDPEWIVAITYTRAAAAEIRKRLGREVGHVGTIHSYALKFLRRHGAILNLPSEISVIDEEAEERLLWDTAERMKYKGSKEALETEVQTPIWSRAGRDLTPIQLINFEFHRWMMVHGAFTNDALIEIANVCAMRANVKPVVLLVDEYQDVSSRTHNFCMTLKASRRFIVGDADQSIFSFCGGSPRHLGVIIGIGDVEVSAISTNYRCGSVIGEAAMTLIRQNKFRRDYPVTFASEVESSCAFVVTPNASVEAAWIARALQENTGTAAVICRTNFVAQATAKALEAYGIPVHVEREYVPKDLKVCQKFIALLAAPNSDFLALEFVNATKGEAAAKKMKNDAAKSMKSVSSLLNLPTVTVADLPQKLALIGVRPDTIEIVNGLIENLGPDEGLAEVASGLLSLNGGEKKEVQTARLEVLTVHKAKGREWDNVFIVGCEQGLFPLSSADLEEERRLFYVAMTRARSFLRLIVCSKRQRHQHDYEKREDVPSRFIVEAGI